MVYQGFKSDCQWFSDNREKIIAGHHGENAAILNREVRGYYPTARAAVDAMKPLEVGQYVVAECLTAEEEARIVMGARRAAWR